MHIELVLPTKSESELIYAGDRKLINYYYLANLKYIEMLSRLYCKRVAYFNEPEDLAQNVYLCFQDLAFDNPAFFGRALYKSFAMYRWGGARKYAQAKSSYAVEVLTILDNPVKGLEKEGATLGDSIPAPDNEQKPDISGSLYTFLRKSLAPEQGRIFSYFYWTGLTYNEIATRTKKAPCTVKRTREEIFKKFRKNSDALRAYLDSLGYPMDYAAPKDA